jgi:homoserine dehydrogenase
MTLTDLETAEPAISHCRAAFENGMHVITCNKGPPALAVRQLREEAARHGVRFVFEGAVLSGTPLFNLAESCLTGNEIEAVSGILNGTCNYILCEMEAGVAYGAALKQAQELGYAEAKPDADVNGADALAKVVILANTLMAGALAPAEVPCEGIAAITPDDIAHARAEGRRYKLIGSVTRENGAIIGRVAPQAIPLSDPLAGVSGATNALTLKTDLLDEITIAGPGAGRTPTGYALLIDLMRIGEAASTR